MERNDTHRCASDPELDAQLERVLRVPAPRGLAERVRARISTEIVRPLVPARDRRRPDLDRW